MARKITETAYCDRCHAKLEVPKEADDLVMGIGAVTVKATLWDEGSRHKPPVNLEFKELCDSCQEEFRMFLNPRLWVGPKMSEGREAVDWFRSQLENHDRANGSGNSQLHAEQSAIRTVFYRAYRLLGRKLT
jgi:hypothetical protein